MTGCLQAGYISHGAELLRQRMRFFRSRVGYDFFYIFFYFFIHISTPRESQRVRARVWRTAVRNNYRYTKRVHRK